MATGKLKVLSLCTFLAMSADPALAGQHLQYYGYYANNGYVGENYDHTNITFIGVWTSDVNQATSIILSELASAKSKGIKAIVTVSPFLFSNGGGNCPFGNQPSSAQYWSAFVSKLVADGYLVPGNPSASTVAAFYPVDEPDGCGLGDVNGAANPALVNAISTIRNNSNTANFPVAAIFSSNYASAARGIQLYDWVGYDNYSLKDWNYVSSFDQFENYVNLSRQRTILVPQAATVLPIISRMIRLSCYRQRSPIHPLSCLCHFYGPMMGCTAPRISHGCEWPILTWENRSSMVFLQNLQANLCHQ